MSIVQEQMVELRRMEGAVQQRPNGLRVLRLLRELQYLEGKLAISMRHAGDFPLVTAVLAGGMILLVMAVVNLPPAQSASTPPVTLPAVVDISEDLQAASARQAREYTNWLGRAHAHAAVQGCAAPMAEAF